VVNASPLISLARIGRLDWLEASEHVLNVPEAVAKEVLTGPPSDPARQALEAGFGGLPTSTPIDLRVVEWGLGAGETAVLSQAMLISSRPGRLDSGPRRATRRLGQSREPAGAQGGAGPRSVPRPPLARPQFSRSLARTRLWR
jgi:hypothetical protein